MKTIVISAVNLRKGGTLTILKQCLEYLSSVAIERDWRVIALVHKKELALYEHIEYIEMPHSISSWWKRLWCEHVEMKHFSQQVGEIDLWLSLHDTTPTVCAKQRVVYCHNSFPFLKWNWRHLVLNPRIVTFSVLTKHLIYRKNIHKNTYLIVQQEWFRKAMHKMFSFPSERIIVSLPKTHHLPIDPKTTNGKYHFLFASYPDVHKNFECLCEAAAALEKELGTNLFKVTLTIGREDNKYTRWLNRRYGHIQSIDFAGFQSKEGLYSLYAESDCLVFPSLVETWGLPISEYSVSEKPMLLADLPYAHETAAGCKQIAFFNPHKATQLKEMMHSLIKGDRRFLTEAPRVEINEPRASSWAEVFEKLMYE